MVAVLTVPAAAQMAQSGDFIVDLSQYQPVGGDRPFLPNTNILQNPGFETGALPPWTTNNWTVTSDDPHTGVYSAQDFGNYWVRQDFDAVPVGDVISISFWSKQPEGVQLQAVDFYYSASDYDEFIVGPGIDWTFFDITSHLRPFGNLVAIRIWGYSGGGPDPDLTRIDDVTIEVLDTAVESSTWGQIKFLYR
jgi:hypothetical protein